jgi:hypothetical protein
MIRGMRGLRNQFFIEGDNLSPAMSFRPVDQSEPNPSKFLIWVKFC